MARRQRSKRSKTSRTRLRPARLAQQLAVVLLVLLLVALWENGTIPRLLERLGMGTAPVPTEAPAQTPAADGAIQVFFTTPSLVYPDIPEQRTLTPIEQALIADIDAARTSIDMATFEYNLTSVGEALVRAQQRGVRVRLALDRENLEKAPMAEWAGLVEDATIPISWEESDGFLHSKFVIIDDAVVWMGSWNLTVNDTYRNNNNLLRLTDPRLVANYRAEFDQMFAGVFGNSKQSLTPNRRVSIGETVIENYFSPEDRAVGQIVSRLEGAQQRIRFLAFSFTSNPIEEAMIARAGSGIPVQGVIESRNAGGQGAEMDKLRAGGVEVLEDGNCYTMHHKVLIIDDRTVITGSYNFTRRAEEVNDENFLIIDSPDLARRYSEEFDRVYQQAQVPTRCGR